MTTPTPICIAEGCFNPAYVAYRGSKYREAHGAYCLDCLPFDSDLGAYLDLKAFMEPNTNTNTNTKQSPPQLPAQMILPGSDGNAAVIITTLYSEDELHAFAWHFNRWAMLNGIPVAGTVYPQTNADVTPEFVRDMLMAWRHPDGRIQAISLRVEANQGHQGHHASLQNLMSWYGLIPTINLTWEAYLAPAVTKATTGEDSLIGAAIPGQPGFFYGPDSWPGGSDPKSGYIHLDKGTGRQYVWHESMFGGKWQQL